ncbi:transcriptional regulator SplA domain-containing protein [Metabacillus herbersteinensis]|uniref:Transcriptional regulator SplA domain-containing protein n=1 Tax=Metabacillus herbersteinensis TaxID=283816 RepID=A0ABV6GAR7_9BACI
MDFKLGETVYVIYRNPHAAIVANILSAEIVQHPINENEFALFLHDSYHPLSDDDAVFSSFDEAERLYNELFDYGQYH